MQKFFQRYGGLKDLGDECHGSANADITNDYAAVAS